MQATDVTSFTHIQVTLHRPAELGETQKRGRAGESEGERGRVRESEGE